jgi:N-acyl-D-aspartate/D-glutamate deacylase
VLVLDPERLDASLEDYAEAPVEQYGGLSRMVNRNDATVSLVMVGGRAVWRSGSPTEALGQERTGQFLRAGEPAPALRPQPVA